MPPKGKPKLTKAEKEKLKKEEAEQKAKDEEEARLRAIEEAIERKAREKVEAELQRQRDNEERKCRREQLGELEIIWQKGRTHLQEFRTERRSNAKWDRYMLCDGSPDPTIPGEINTFMNLWREDLSNINMRGVQKDSKLILSLLDELEFLLEDTPPEEITELEVEQHKNTMTELQILLKEKLDLACHQLLLEASTMPDEETGNLQQVISDGTITLCVWGNLSKNLRIKMYEFAETGFGFEIPKLLALSDCAFSVLMTKYDHYSPSCKYYNIRIKKKAIEEDEEEAKADEEAGPQEGKELEAKDEEGSGDAEADGVSREESKISMDVMAALRMLDGEDEEVEKKEEEEVVEKEPLEEDYDMPSFEPPEFEDFDGDEDVVDLRAYRAMGGTFHFYLLHLPPQPKFVNAWSISKMVDYRLSFMDYQCDAMTPISRSASKDGASPSGESTKEKKEMEKPPIAVSFRLPGDVYYFEEPQVGLWDKDLKQWRLEGFTDCKFDEEARVLSFKTYNFGTMALFQDSHINMPFQSWEIRPRATNHAVLTIIAAIVEVEIQIKGDQCCLTQPENRTELDHLRGQWYPLKTFIKRMQQAGVNLFPCDDSNKYVSIQSKDCVTEERLYQQMAMTSSLMAYSWSKWNSEINDSERILIQGAQQLVDEPLLEEAWSLFMIHKKRTTKLKMTEFEEEFSDEPAEGTEFQADLYHMTLDLASPTAQERINESSHEFVDTIYEMLRATRLVTYS